MTSRSALPVASDSPSVECRDVRAVYGDVVALDRVTVTLRRGVTAVLGENGAGKSTLFAVIAGLRRPVAGTVTRTPSSARVRLVPQHVSLLPWLTVREYAVYSAYMAGLSRRDARAGAEPALERVGLGHKRDAACVALSGGEQRRLAVAGALAARPGVLLLDEPTAGLDPLQREAVNEVVRELGTDHVVAISSHVSDDVNEVAADVVVLGSGQVRFAGSFEALVRECPEGPGSLLARALRTFGAPS